jgi:hypothetical protein
VVSKQCHAYSPLLLLLQQRLHLLQCLHLLLHLLLRLLHLLLHLLLLRLLLHLLLLQLLHEPLLN